MNKQFCVLPARGGFFNSCGLNTIIDYKAPWKLRVRKHTKKKKKRTRVTKAGACAV